MKKESTYPFHLNDVLITNEVEQRIATLLIETDKSYREIAGETGAPYSRVAYFGPKFRSEERRRAIKAQTSREIARKQHEQQKEMTVDSVASQPSFAGEIRRKVSFNYESSGEGVSISLFTKELQDLLLTLEKENSQTIDFFIQLKAEG